MPIATRSNATDVAGFIGVCAGSDPGGVAEHVSPDGAVLVEC